MNKPLSALACLVLAFSTASAQENVFIVEPNSNSMTASDSATLAPYPLSGAQGGPNPIPVGTAPSSIIYDPVRKLIYTVASGTVTVFDPLVFSTKTTITMPGAGGLRGAVLSSDGQWLFMAGNDVPNKRSAIYQLDLNNLTNGGAKIAAALTASDPLNPVACEVLPASAVGGSGSGPGRLYLTVQGLIWKFDLLTTPVVGVQVPLPTAVPTPPPTITAPVNAGRMARSPDGRFVLVTANTGSPSPSSWQVIRLNPLATPEADFFILTNPSGNAGNSIDDVLFKGGSGPPFAATIMARDDANASLEFFNISATGPATNHTSGPDVPFQFGSEFTYDPMEDRIYVAWNGTTSFTQGYRVYDPAISTTTFQSGNSTGANGHPTKVAFAPKPPPMSISYVTEPAGVTSAGSFQLEIHGQGFIQGSSVARVQDNTFGVLTPATTTTVLSPNVIIATWPTLSSENFDVSVHNNDGQLSVLNTFFQGLDNPSQKAPITVTLPPVGAGYSMLSFPQYATVGDLRAAVAAQLGTYSPVNFRLFLWQGRYLELNNPKLSSSTSIMGTGFLGISRLGAKLQLDAPDVTLNTNGGQRVVALASGWNLISLPYHVNLTTDQYSYASINVDDRQDLGTTPAVPATASPLVTPVLYELQNGKYVTTTTMVAGRSYWVLNQTAGPVYMIFFQGSVFKAGSPPSSSAPAPGSPTPPPPPGALEDSGSGQRGGCGLLGPELVLLAFFLRRLGRRRLAA